MAVGAKGVISVASNIIPGELKEMVDAFASGNLEKAQRFHSKYYPLFKNLFLETNPIPIKAAMAMKGLIEEEYRLPMCLISDKNRKILKATLEDLGI